MSEHANSHLYRKRARRTTNAWAALNGQPLDKAQRKAVKYMLEVNVTDDTRRERRPRAEDAAKANEAPKTSATY